ncbi:MAG: DUF3048 domain-containing protein [Nocardioidaceae bacterium]
MRSWGAVRRRGAAPVRALAGAALATSAALVLGACGGSPAPGPAFSPVPTSSGSSTPTSLPSATRSTPPPAGYAPLTGVAVASAAALARPVVAVTVTLAPGVATSGVGAADVVYQEFDRPGRSRLLALFQSADSTSVGPVSSTAPVDLRLLFLLSRPPYAYNGGPTGFVAQAQAGPVNARSVALFPTLYRGGASGPVTSTAALRASVRGAAAPPAGTLAVASAGTPLPTAGKALHKILVTVPGHSTQAFTWTGKGWVGPAGTTVSNVIVQVVPYKTITPHKSAAVGSAQVVGSGPATVFARDHAVTVAWQRLQPGFVTSYRVGINPVGLAPGRTWILLVPAGTTVTAS